MIFVIWVIELSVDFFYFPKSKGAVSLVNNMKILSVQTDILDDGMCTFCYICKKDLSRYNSQRKMQHINRCADQVSRDLIKIQIHAFMTLHITRSQKKNGYYN